MNVLDAQADATVVGVGIGAGVEPLARALVRALVPGAIVTHHVRHFELLVHAQHRATLVAAHVCLVEQSDVDAMALNTD